MKKLVKVLMFLLVIFTISGCAKDTYGLNGKYDSIGWRMEISYGNNSETMGETDLEDGWITVEIKDNKITLKTIEDSKEYKGTIYKPDSTLAEGRVLYDLVWEDDIPDSFTNGMTNIKGVIKYAGSLFMTIDEKEGSQVSIGFLYDYDDCTLTSNYWFAKTK